MDGIEKVLEWEECQKEIYLLTPLFENIDYDGPVAELSVGDMVLSKTDPVPALTEQYDTLDK